MWLFQLPYVSFSNTETGVPIDKGIAVVKPRSAPPKSTSSSFARSAASGATSSAFAPPTISPVTASAETWPDGDQQWPINNVPTANRNSTLLYCSSIRFDSMMLCFAALCDLYYICAPAADDADCSNS